MEDKISRAFHILDEWGILAACGLSLFLSLSYFWPAPLLPTDLRDFLRSLITNVIPVLLLFVASYFLLRNAQTLRSEVDRQALIDAISAKTRDVLVDQFDNIALKVECTSQLVRDWDQKGVERVCTEDETGAIRETKKGARVN